MTLASRPDVLKRPLPLCLYPLPAWLFLAVLVPAAQSQATYTGTVDFGAVNVGAASGPQTLTFSFSSPTALNVTTPVQVLTMGAAGLDFKNAGTGTCGGSTYSSCTVIVTFSPTAPGLRLGAVVIEGASGNVLTTAYIHGLGQGPQIAYNPGVASNVGISATDPQGVAVDGTGNVYIADNGTSSVYKVTPGGIQTTFTSGITGLDGITLDGAGNVYLASTSSTTITKITPSGAQSTIGSGLSFPAGMAADGLGDIFIANVGANNIVEVTPSGTQTTLGTGLNTPAGVAVDAAGNVFVADTSNGRVIKIAPGGAQTEIVGPPFDFPESIAVDAADNLYVALANGEVYQITPAPQAVNLLATLSFPVGVAVDSVGNVYVAQGNIAVELNRSTAPTVEFLATDPVGSLSTDSPQSVTIDNIGNASLSFPVPGSGTNPSISTDFSLGTTTTCPKLTTSSSTAGTLASGATCLYAIDFTPTTAGTISGALVTTDNALNVTNATQSVALNNKGVPALIAATVTVNTVVATATGSPIPVTATTVPAGLAVTILYGPFGGTPNSTVDPSAPGFYSVTATVTTPGYSGSGAGYLIINGPPQTTPTITWATPPPITVGTALSASQLNAIASTPGTFTYSIAAGTVLAAGSYPITASFTPTDTTDFTSASATVTLVVQGNIQAITPINFGTINIGTTSSTETVTFQILNAVTLNSTAPDQVFTQGTVGLDFHNTGAGTCAAGAYAIGASCTVTVNLTPATAGARSGAVVLVDTSGNALATAYLYGIGAGPQIAYDPGVQSAFASGVVSEGVTTDTAGNVYINTGSSVVKVAPGGAQTTVGTGFSSEGGIAVDGAGNLYVADTGNNRIAEFTVTGTIRNVGTGYNFPYGVAVDGAGNVYVADTKNGQAVEVTAAGVQSTIATGFTYPEGIAVDGAGNVYVSDNQGGAGIVFKVAPGGTQSIVTTGLLSPAGVAVDAAGNVFVAGATNQTVAKVSTTGVKTTFVSGLSFPFGLAVDSAGDLFIAHATSAAGVIEVNRSTIPSLSFASTNVGSVSSDSPQAVTVENIGNATLSFPRPATGTNASISTNFLLTHSTTCPQSTAASTLTSGASCVYPAEFLPTASGVLSGSIALTDNALNVAGSIQNIVLSGTGNSTTITATVTLGSLSQTYTGSPLSATAATSPAGLTVAFTYNGSGTPPTAAGTYAVVGTVTSSGYTGSATGTLTIAKAIPVITWVTPAAISAGTALSATQLNATATVAGTFVYSPVAGTIPATGTDTLSVTFTPTDTTDYTTSTQTVSLAVGQTTPVITWVAPSAISYGTALSATQLNATASVAGTFVYTPEAGTTPTAGTDTLSVTFTPADTTDYTTATKTVSLVVNQATPTISWTTPTAITYGTTLGATQLNATAPVGGTFVYTPVAGTTPATGTDTLSVTFTPTDTTDYTTATKTVSLVVGQATPVITWTAPASITYGTSLSTTQLNATSSVPGTFSYNPAAGATPTTGTDSLSVTFTPTDATDYTSTTKTVSLVVSQATPAITWATPAAISAGTALSTTQLNATASVPGTFVYNPAAGTIPAAGTDTLSVTFTPTDTTDYTTATKSVSLAVCQSTPIITWATPSAISYGTALSATQINATASVAGTFVYTPALGAIPAAGTDTLSVTFTPTDTTDYMIAAKTVSLVVTQSTPVITWATPTAISAGTALSAAQLNATASVPGTFAYTPALGSIPAAGTDTLSVTFTPTDTTDYTTAIKTVSLTVGQTTPVLTWLAPSAITYGTALSTTQLNATASVPGTFVYTPAAGTTPTAGTDTLSVTFTPNDTADYTTATKIVSLVVSQATPVITWATPASISYGTALNATQLNATASVPGTFVYTPAAGTVPAMGSDTLSVTFTPTDTTDYTTATKTVSLTVGQTTPVLTWPPPAALTYGTALSSTQLNATASVTGSFSYTPAVGTILTAGTFTLTTTFTPTDTTDYSTATKTVGITINPAPLSLSANNATRLYGLANPVFTGTITGTENGDTLTESFTTSATTLSNVGAYSIVPSGAGNNLASYTQTVTNGSLTITQAGSTATLSVSSTSISPGQSVTLTAQIASATSGIPTGSVQFFDGTTLLNTATLSSGTASYSTTTFAAGTSHALTAVYLGDANFTGSNSGAAKTVTVSGVLDFSITPITLSNNIFPGSTASYSFQITPGNGGYPASVSFAATGLPAGATATFSPATIPASGGAQTVTVSILTASAIGSTSSPAPLSPLRGLGSVALGLLLLPFAGARRLRRSGRNLARIACHALLFAAATAVAIGLTGCGSGNGFFGEAPASYTVTLTATSGTVQHSTTVTLNVQ